MNEAFMDILSDNHRLDACAVVLLGPGHGAAPTIRRISAEHFLIRLHTVMGWAAETTNLRVWAHRLSSSYVGWV
jgi:hypothetical protein